MTDRALATLARAAGILVEWDDASGVPCRVSSDTLRAVLAALGLPSANDRQIRESRLTLKHGADHAPAPAMLTGASGRTVTLPALLGAARRYRIDCEDGAVVEGPVIEHGKHAVLPPIERPGYHRLQLDDHVATLAIAPRRCPGVIDVAGRHRAWTLVAQLYSLRGHDDGGLANYGLLGELAAAVARLGSSALCVSPVHAMFAADPARFSPYAPSNRLFFNALYIDIRRLCDLAAVPVDDPTGNGDASPHADETSIDWPGVAQARMSLARKAFDAMVTRGLLTPHTHHGGLFSDYRACRGTALERHARFEALHACLVHCDPGRSHWRDWPDGLRDPDGAEVTAFARESAIEVAFHAFLQWRAESDLAEAQAAARGAGMAIGLITDLAVGTDDSGSYAWGYQGDLLSNVSIGAPPDAFGPLGQNWGLTSFSPRALPRRGFAPFIDLLRAGLRHSGGMRIDHILGLHRLWVIPRGASPRDGAYLKYPMRDLLRLVALETWRHGVVVVGEDLGTVPTGLRAALRGFGIMGTRVLWFERQQQDFTPAALWPRQVLASTSTHDLPTVVGWWQGRDIEWRTRLGLMAAGETEESLRTARQADRRALWKRLLSAGVVQGDMPPAERGMEVLDGVIGFLATTSCSLLGLPLEDALGLIEQPNLPGTTTQHPNWQQRLDRPVVDLLQDPAVRRRLGVLSTVR